MNCKFCGKEIKGNKGALKMHESWCFKNPNKNVLDEQRILSISNTGKKRRNQDGWICRYCGTKLDTFRELRNHNHENHPEHNRCVSKKVEWTCKYCNEIFSSRRKLSSHSKECSERLKQPLDSKGRVIPSFDREKAAKEAAMTRKKNGWKHTVSKDTRLAMSLRMKEKVGYAANFSKKACTFIDELNARMGWNLQHALNGGEITVGPYYLDGYDAKRNIAFEYDEPAHHYSKKKEHDEFKQNFIISTIHCEFWRYDEKNDLLYKVTDGENPNGFHIVGKSLKKCKEPYKCKDTPYQRFNFNNNLKQHRWTLIESSDIDFSKYGWVKEVSKLFGISENKAGKYIKDNFPEFYETCYRRNSN